MLFFSVYHQNVQVAVWLKERKAARREPRPTHAHETRENFLLSGSAFCADSYFGIRSTPRVTTVARKRSRPSRQKCRWQVTAKHAYTLRMWLCMK